MKMITPNMGQTFYMRDFNPGKFQDTKKVTFQQSNNSKKSQLITPNIKCWLSKNQNAMSDDTDDQFSNMTSPNVSVSKTKVEIEKSSVASDKLSLIYVKTHHDKLYKIVFRTSNTTIIPLYTVERYYVDKENDKIIQPISKSSYVEKYTPELSRFNTMSKEYKIYPQRERYSIMSFKKKIGKARKVEPIPRKPKAGISTNKTNRFKSVVYVNYHNITFKLYPKVMMLDFSKPLLGENLMGSILNNLGLESYSSKKNKGSIVARHKGDILKFTFSMEDVNCQEVVDQISRAIQVQDNNIYLRQWSTVSYKVVQVPLPRTNYYYIDPMVRIKRKNETMKLNNIEPRWLYKERKTRMSLSKQCQQVDPAQKAYEATSGSSILYSDNNSINKAREGLVKCFVIDGDEDKYEKWVIGTQRHNKLQSEETEKIIETEVPDWDLVMYQK